MEENVICSNCDEYNANHICATCCWDTLVSTNQNELLSSETILSNLKKVTNAALFCSTCQKIHLKIKATKDHSVLAFKTYDFPCCNCDDLVSLHLCLECLVDNAKKFEASNQTFTARMFAILI